MRNRITTSLGLSFAGLCSVLAACSSRTDVSLTGNTPAQYSHVWITTQEVWFNSSATAGPDDGGWVKFTLKTPTTVDLVQESGGNLGSIDTDLKLVPGTYSQIRLIPVDSEMPLTRSAQSVGALHNFEVDYVDSGKTPRQLPLELLNPDKGIGIQTSLKVRIGSASAALSSTSAAGAATGTPFGITNGTLTGNTNGTLTGQTNGSPTFGGTIGTTSSTGTLGTTSTNTAPRNEFAISVLGASDLVPFTYGTPATAGIMLSSHAAAYDLTRVAGINGQLSLTNLTGTTSTSSSGLPAIQATAEVLSEDGSRWVAVASTPVNADGTFLIYPLQSSTSSPVYYDVVIHGPGIATIIIQSVNVELGSCSSSNSLTNSNCTNCSGSNSLTSSNCTNCTTSNSLTSSNCTNCASSNSLTNSNCTNCSGSNSLTSSTCNTGTTGTTGTTGMTGTMGTTGTTSSTSNTAGTATTSATATTTTGTSINVAAVSLGTLFPRAATSYTANLAKSPAENLPAGSLIGFYQTLGGANEVPHLIESSAIDPFNQVLANPQALSAGTIDYGTWNSTNASVTVVSAAPAEGVGGYTVSATAPSFAGGPLTSSYRIKPPASSTTTPVTIPTLPALTLASGTTSGTLSVAVSEAAPGKYNHGELLVSESGKLVATAPLDSVFASGTRGTVTVSGIPAQTPTALYYVSVRAWNSSDPSTTLHRQWYPAPLDLRTSASGSSELTVN